MSFLENLIVVKVLPMVWFGGCCCLPQIVNFFFGRVHPQCLELLLTSYCCRSSMYLVSFNTNIFPFIEKNLASVFLSCHAFLYGSLKSVQVN
jgi:hypothetical protein